MYIRMYRCTTTTLPPSYMLVVGDMASERFTCISQIKSTIIFETLTHTTRHLHTMNGLEERLTYATHIITNMYIQIVGTAKVIFII